MTTKKNHNLSAQQKEVDVNAEAFFEMLPSLIEQGYGGKFALMHEGKIEVVFETFADALAAGDRIFSDKPFSIQEITDTPINLGSYSYLV